MGLSEAQVTLIQDSWGIITKTKKQSGVDLFLSFFTKYPEYKNHFKQFTTLSLDDLRTHPKMAAHGLTVMHMIDSWIDHLGDFDILQELVNKNAVRHAGRGMKDDEFKHLWAVITVFVQEKLGDTFSGETAEAWTLGISALDSMSSKALTDCVE